MKLKYPKNLTGLKFGRLTVIKQVDPPEHLRGKGVGTFWLCRCICGNEKVIPRNSLVTGATKSCGCIHREQLVKRNKENAKHGMSRSKIFYIWQGMIQRCHNKNNKYYKRYGERGIFVVDEWHKFENFYNDMMDSYNEHVKKFGEKNTTLERIDNDKPYCKENCRQATYKEQANNRRKREEKVVAVIDGVEYTFKELSEKFNISIDALKYRYYKLGKRDKELLEKPKREVKGIEVEVNGVIYKSLKDLHKDYPYLDYSTIARRYREGLRDEELVRPPKNKNVSNGDD